MVVSAAFSSRAFNARLCRNAVGCARWAFVVLNQRTHLTDRLNRLAAAGGQVFEIRPVGRTTHRNLRHGLFAAKLWACGDAFARCWAPCRDKSIFKGAAPPITDETEFFHIRTWFPIVPAICLFVLGLLIYRGLECDCGMIQATGSEAGGHPQLSV